MLIDFRSVGRAQRLRKRLLNRYVASIVLDVVDHLNRKCQPYDVHPQALDLRHNRRNGLVLQTFRYHHIGRARPIHANIGDVQAGGVLNPLFVCYKGRIWEGGKEAGERECAEERGEKMHIGGEWRTICYPRREGRGTLFKRPASIRYSLVLLKLVLQPGLARLNLRGSKSD